MLHRLARLLVVALVFALPACKNSKGTTIFDPTAFLGTWAGTWTNTTFSSTGAANVVVAQNGSDLTFTVDLDGNVFGGANPAAEVFTAIFDTSRVSLGATTSAVYGDLTGTLNANGSYTISGTNINGSVASFTMTGNWTGTQINANVAITFDDTTTAAATGSLTKQ
ncbi:MAG: hypothetical protein HZB39_16400 [Planctomycetes bacterium]|nr:hypothetical protein [Planctomycetota bacterium]